VLWNAWADKHKPWMGLGNPCIANDCDLFASATTVIVGIGKKALFGESTWLEGMRTKNIAPKIYEIAHKRTCTVNVALTDSFWVDQINTHQGITVEHNVQFSKIWEMIEGIQLSLDSLDKISWKFGKDASYSVSSAYKMQFLGQTSSMMPALVWKPWAPTKCKIFSWLIIQNQSVDVG
jgi:hypothetical protein